MTEPAGTVRLDAVVMVPTVRLAAVSALDAAACVRFTTSGTPTCGKPEDTTRDTAVLMTTSVPAAGFWLMIDPAGTVRLDAVVTAPTARLAAVRALLAAAWVRLTTSGTATCGSPDDTTSATAVLMTTSAPAAGS